MKIARLILIACLASPASPASAQNFFERLFGVQPQPRPPQNVPVPAAPRAPAPPSAPAPAEREPASGGSSTPAQPAAPPPPKPIVLKPPSEDTVLGRELKLNGSSGSLRIERAASRSDPQARMTLAGTKVAQPAESCTVNLAAGEPMPLASEGRPEGTVRYTLAAPSCPLRFDVLDGAVLVGGPTEACTLEEAACRVDPRGIWGPEPAALLPKARDIEQTRGSSDRAVRENYRTLTQRARPEAVRPIVAEQAAFSSERETTCRSYARESAHGFCNARFTEARALLLASRLGLIAPDKPGPEANSRSRRRPPAGASPPAAQPPSPGSPASGSDPSDSQ